MTVACRRTQGSQDSDKEYSDPADVSQCATFYPEYHIQEKTKEGRKTAQIKEIYNKAII